MKIIKWAALPVLCLAAVACSSVKKADVAATSNPSEEIAGLEQKMEQGYAGHFDILAEDDFAKSQKYLKEAKEDLSDGQDQKEILGNVGYAQTYFTRASEKAATRREKIPGIIEARQKALDAGTRKYPPTTKELAKLDGDVRSEAERLDKISAEDQAELQSRYLQLELNAVKNTQLGRAAGMIQGAIDKKAKDDAPKALKRAQVDYKNAENLISANRNSAESYSEAVAKASNSADLLVAITAATKGGDVDENTATKIVMQERQISSLEGQVTAGTEANQKLGTEMAEQGQALAKAGAAVSLQQSIESARKEFGKEEADVFQQGDKLLIRLKSMNFASGRSDLPSESLPVLAKVKSVADGLSAREVRVEGHTDSTGSAQINGKLSEARASAIEKYLETTGLDDAKVQSVGYGFKKPIATNKSKEGRSQNRRVDIIITPDKAQTPEKSEQM